MNGRGGTLMSAQFGGSHLLPSILAGNRGKEGGRPAFGSFPAAPSYIIAFPMPHATQTRPRPHPHPSPSAARSRSRKSTKTKQERSYHSAVVSSPRSPSFFPSRQQPRFLRSHPPFPLPRLLSQNLEQCSRRRAPAIKVSLNDRFVFVFCFDLSLPCVCSGETHATTHCQLHVAAVISELPTLTTISPFASPPALTPLPASSEAILSSRALIRSRGVSPSW